MKTRIKGRPSVLEEFEAYLNINKNDLDNVVSTHSSLLHEVGKEYAKATGEAITKKDQLKKVEAKLAGTHRKKLENLGRCTESMINHAVLLDTRREESFQKWNKAVIHADKLESLRDSFKSRGFMIRDMVGMILSDHYNKDSFDSSEEIKNYKQQKVRAKRKLR